MAQHFTSPIRNNIVDNNDNVKEKLELIIKPVTSYRITKIEVQRSDAIDQIKITYDDGAIWHNGHDGGKADPRSLVMTKGEYLVRVTHERLFNYKCAGAGVEFETNKGRIFSYQPLCMATKWKNEQTTIHAMKGKEIISLAIRRGVLLGSEQQPVPSSELIKHPDFWHTIVSYGEKEDNISSDSEDTIHQHFFNKSEALENWDLKLKYINEKKGRGAILINCMKSKILKEGGNKKAVELCTDEATKTGYCTSNKEEDLSMWEIVLMLYVLLGKKKDLFSLIIIVTFISFSIYLNIEAQILTGHVLSLVSSNQSNIRETNTYIKYVCDNLIVCDGLKSNLSKAVIISFLAVKIIATLAHVFQIYIRRTLTITKECQLRCGALDHILSLDQRYHDTHSIAHIRGSTNVDAISDLVFWQFPYLATFTFKFLLISYYLISIDIYLGGFCVLCILVMKYGLLDPLTRRVGDVYKSQRKLNLINVQIFDDVLNMITSIKMFSKERHHTDVHNICEQRVIKNLTSVIGLRCLSLFFGGIFESVMFSGAIYIGLLYITTSKMTSGELTGFFFLLQEFQQLYEIIKLYRENIRRQFSNIERFRTLLDEKPSIVDGPLNSNQINGEIVFTDVNFEYPSRPSEKVLKGFNMNIQAHKMTAIVGDSGAGKSTIANLIMRMYDITSGSITIDGHDIKNYNREHLHKNVTIVNQSPNLFNTSLAENIGYGVAGGVFTNRQVNDAARIANCGFISKFRAGFDTHAGSSGKQLSGGQKQRIAIARSAIRDPRVLILDEATSSLDAENEKDVQEALENVMVGRTIIVIAHRLSTIKNADEIICMKDGKW